jgi:hypothetical protein
MNSINTSNNNIIDSDSDYWIGYNESEFEFESEYNYNNENLSDLDSSFKYKNDIHNDYEITKSELNLSELENFESNLPVELSKEKKMSLLIVVLLQMVFNNNNEKLDRIYDFLNKKKPHKTPHV